MLVLLIVSFFMGFVSIVIGYAFRKNPYINIKDKPRLMKVVTPETAALYAALTSPVYILGGIITCVAAVIAYLIKSDFLMLCAMLIPLFAAVIYCYYQEKVITQKVPVLYISLMSLLLFVVMLSLGVPYIETSVKVDDERVKFGGVYWENIELRRLDNVQLLDTLPSIGLRTNGVSISGNHKGYYLSRSLGGNVKLLLNSNFGPFIYLWTSEPKRCVIVNFRNREKTTAIYNQLKTLTEE